ncbi:MAG: hypothetical protein IEMM0008_1206 [bacterium]|nr:MAG: hypothetical protein IEMM0008_1206 [bacterium]
MGTKVTLFITSLFILVNCSPKIAVMNGQDITRSQFSQLLEASQPKYFAQNHDTITKKLSNWKRLKTALVDYLNDYSVWKELQEKNIADSIPQKKKDLFDLVSLGEYTFILLKGKKSADQRKSKIPLIFEDKVLKSYLLDNRLDKDLSNEERIILSVKGYISVNLRELISFFPDKRKKDLYNFISKTLVPMIENALEGKALGFQRHPQCLKWQKLKWRKYLIHVYRAEMKEQYRTSILANQESQLKKYYEKNKNQLAYKELKNKKKETLQKYHFSYNRVKNDLVDTFVDKKMNKWKKGLWRKYKIRVEESYFDKLGQQEIEELQKTNH